MSVPETIHFSEMPSNIALIKYMGKIAGVDKNRPTNSSISFTLSHLKSRVEIVESNEMYDSWQSISGLGWIPTQLSDRGRKRFLAHFGFLKQKLGIQGQFQVRSANNFPSDCGIASSASSFAALTSASYNLAQTQNSNLDLSLARLSDLSRVGSGSSIRSFMAPFVMWNQDGISALETPFPDLQHRVVIVESGKKAIGSSDAHERVPTSLLFLGRPERAEARLKELLLAFESKDWGRSYQIMWSEFWDMHSLFATSEPVFGYMSDASMNVLNTVSQYWATNGDGPLVTMDAGPNIHLLYRADQNQDQATIEQEILSQLKSRNFEAQIL